MWATKKGKCVRIQCVINDEINGKQRHKKRGRTLWFWLSFSTAARQSFDAARTHATNVSNVGRRNRERARTACVCVCVPNDTKQINVNVYWTRNAFDEKNRKNTKIVNKNLFFPFKHSNGRACVYERETEKEREYIWIVFVIFKSRQFHSHITNYRLQFRHPWQCTHCYCFGTMHDQKMRTSFGPVMASTTIAIAIIQSQPISLRSFSSSSWRWFSFFFSLGVVVSSLRCAFWGE